MSYVSVHSSDGYVRDIECYSIECPFCHSLMTPVYLYYHESYLFALCSNTSCAKHMVLTKDKINNHFIEVAQNYSPKQRLFSTTINNISPFFITIYNQAYFAEQFSLNQICGVGYRKALEFLIKDYLLYGVEDEKRIEMIKNKQLGKCIQEDISDDRIKNVALRATWLGNDETHYIRKWADKDVSHLKQLIDLTIRWIENEVETKQLLDDMPQKV